QEYLDMFAANPVRFSRDAARYVRDMFDFFGTYTVNKPWGELTRYRLFDLPWEPEPESGTARSYHGRDAALVAHEELQSEIYRALCNSAGGGRATRPTWMPGPNGSAKTPVAGCLLRALEHSSPLDDGALYRSHWVFPSRKTVRGSIGFGSSGPPSAAGGKS